MNATFSSEQKVSTQIPKFKPQDWNYRAVLEEKIAKSILGTYTPISLEEMETVALLRRVDTKYVLSAQQLFQALDNLKGRYWVLDIQGKRLNHYHNLYFDTSDFTHYHEHHNQQRNRYKVRCREYVDTHLTYLEIKRKNNRDQTIKSRLKTKGFVNDLAQSGAQFLTKNYPGEPQNLQPVLWNDFLRITLVSKQAIERLTLDINLQFSNGWDQIGLRKIAVAEVKQENFSIHSNFMQQMRGMKIQPMRFSKYCMGIPLFYPQVKHNRFKPRKLLIERIMRQGDRYGHRQ